MNIFVLSKILKYCAIYLPDKHVVKMILEYAQLLSTAHHVLSTEGKKPPEGIYRKTHVNHPCAIWVRKSDKNYTWLYNLWILTLKEYTFRFKKIHASSRLISVLKNLPPKIPITSKRTPFAQAMPENYRKSLSKTVDAYRNYFIGAKSHLAKWKPPRSKPYWWVVKK